MRNYVHITQPVERLQPDERSQLCRHVMCIITFILLNLLNVYNLNNVHNCVDM